MDLSLGEGPLTMWELSLIFLLFYCRFYIGSRFNVVVCDSSMIEEILVGHSDKLSCGGPYIVSCWPALSLMLHYTHDMLCICMK